jgi:YHS domain-containing protein
MVNLLSKRSTVSGMMVKPDRMRTGGTFHARWSTVSFALVSVCLTNALLLTPVFNSLTPAVAVEVGLPDFPLMADPLTGRALFGYDPVAYFAAGEARKGQDDLVARWSGVDFHFSSIANRDHFLANPASFIPQLGGHDAGRVKAGYMVFGDPRLFLVQNKQLWFFRDEASKKAFMTNPEIASNSITQWKTLFSK